MFLVTRADGNIQCYFKINSGVSLSVNACSIFWLISIVTAVLNIHNFQEQTKFYLFFFFFS